jgi:protein-S-isoprenylcysteine O-methyltransferase Ste14
MVDELVDRILLVRPSPNHLAAPQTWTYRAALITGGILLAPPTAWLLSEAPLWQFGHRGTFVLLAIMLIGLCFTWWARIHLGRLWSGVITHKEGHKIQSTPGLLSRYSRQRL